MSRYLISNVLGLVGAIAGGVLGFYTFRWLLGQGFYGLIIPGAFLGLGCSLLRTASLGRSRCVLRRCRVRAVAVYGLVFHGDRRSLLGFRSKRQDHDSCDDAHDRHRDGRRFLAGRGRRFPRAWGSTWPFASVF